MKNSSKLAIILSTVGILIGLYAQYDLYSGYLKATGKTKALYGLQHLKYFKFISFSFLAFVLSILSAIKKEKSTTVAVIICLSIVSFFTLLHSWWRYFV